MRASFLLAVPRVNLGASVDANSAPSLPSVAQPVLSNRSVSSKHSSCEAKTPDASAGPCQLIDQNSPTFAAGPVPDALRTPLVFRPSSMSAFLIRFFRAARRASHVSEATHPAPQDHGACCGRSVAAAWLVFATTSVTGFAGVIVFLSGASCEEGEEGGQA